MKIKKGVLIIAGLLAAIAISLIFPLRYHFADKRIPSLPAHHTYNEIVLHSLRDSIIDKAQKNNCKKYLLPVHKIEGNVKTDIFPSLIEDINIALASYTKWKLLASQQEILNIKNRYDSLLAKWGTMLPSEALLNTLQTQSQTVFTDYSAGAKLLKAPENKGDDLKLIVTVNNENTYNQVFKIEVHFVHPETLAKWKKARQVKILRLQKLKKQADISYLFLMTFTGILLLYLVFILIIYLFKKVKEKREKEFYLMEINKRQELADKGHFVAAYQLVDKYLSLFPNDADIIAFKERLLDFTNNDPKKAQVAFVEEQKLQMRLRMMQDNPGQAILAPAEKERLSQYLPYYPQLEKSYHLLVSGEEKAGKLEKDRMQFNEIKELLSAGKLYEAEKLFQTLENVDQLREEKETLGKEIKEKKEKAQQKWKALQQYLMQGETTNAFKLLTELLEHFRDMPEALSLKEDIDNYNHKALFVLCPKNTGRKIVILPGDRFLIGRMDDDVSPDITIDDKRVSRRHASVFVSNNQLFIEDLNSTGGTFLNGKKINRQSLQTGDLITLAKVVDFKVSVTYTNEQQIGGCILSGDAVDHLLLFSCATIALKMEKLIIGTGEFNFYYRNDLLICATGKTAFIMKAGIELNLNNIKYIVEVK